MTDHIEKRITLRATPARVWRAISDAREFSAWFQVDLHDDFAPGTTVRGKLTIKGMEHLTMEIVIERMERERLLSFRWHPYAIDPAVDYSAEPPTLVELQIEPTAEGTLLVVTESGFDKVPAARRLKAFEMNSNGWAAQLRNIERHVA